MKKYINILFAAAVSALALVSCVKEQEVKPGTPDAEDCQGVYFPKQDVIEETQIFDPTQEKVAIIKVARGVSEGALTIVPKVSLSEITSAGTVDGDVALFTVSDIVFEDGQTETEIEIEFPEVKEGVQYSLHLAVEGDQYTSKYSSKVNTCDFKVMCVAYQDFLNPKTKERAKITFTHGWWGEKRTAYIKYYEVDGIRHCVTYDEALVGTTTNGAHVEKGGFWGVDPNQHLEFLWYQVDEEECSECGEKHPHTIPAGYAPAPEGGELMTFVEYQKFQLFDGQPETYVVDYYGYQRMGGYAKPFLHFIEANELFDNACYYDKNGGFYFWVLGYNNISNRNSGWSFPEDYDIIGIAEGFTRADYSLKLDAGITEYNATAEANVVPVSFQVGPDVDKVGYTILEGIASGAAIDAEEAAIAKDTIDFKYATFVEAEGKSFTDSIALDKSGIYTLVAVGLDTLKKAQSAASITFKYLATDDQDKVIVSVSASSTADEASKGYSSTSSIKYSIAGAGITGAIPMIFSEKDAEKKGGIDAIVADILDNPNDYYSMLKDEEYKKYCLSAEALAAANDKGYVSIETGLSANTTYYVVVWATNGYGCAVGYASQATEGLPNEIIKKGTGTYTYALYFTDADGNPADDNGLNLEYNPNTKLYEIPNWGYGVTFAFSVEDNKISVPIQSTGYTSPSNGEISVMDYSHIDEYFGQSGVADYLGLDPNEKGYIDDDGNYHFILIYVSPVGYAWFSAEKEEMFYPNGKPAGIAVVRPTRKVMSFNGELVAFKGEPIVKSDNHFIKIAAVEGLAPVTRVQRVAAKHSVTSKVVKSAKDHFTLAQFDMRKKMN